MPHIATLARLIPDVFRLEMADAQPFKIDGVYCRILPLTRGLWCIVDDADFEWLNQYKWQARPHHSGKTFYAVRMQARPSEQRTIMMHAELCTVGADHINLCGWDNRRKNLRPASKSSNSANCLPRKGRKYKGVYRKRGRNEWYESAITVHRKRIFLGNHRKPENAARAYDHAAIEHFGEFARLNFPNGEHGGGHEG